MASLKNPGTDKIKTQYCRKGKSLKTFVYHNDHLIGQGHVNKNISVKKQEQKKTTKECLAVLSCFSMPDIILSGQDKVWSGDSIIGVSIFTY